MLPLSLRIRGLHHQYDENKVLHDVNIDIVRGEIVGLVGPSGCGKSTLLKSILGTLTPTSGAVETFEPGSSDGQRVTGPGRDRGIVYQRYALFPNLTALDNVAIGPKLDETSYPFRVFNFPAWRKLRAQHRERSAALLKKVGLGDALDKYPHELSGGMQQRVAIAQALVMKPAILLLDEPFGALDEATREGLQGMLLSLYEDNCAARRAGEAPPYTILIVTHELNEAIYVGDRVIGLSQYWDWSGDGFDGPPGATVIYDRAAPVYRPNAPKEYEQFMAQREQIRGAVFEPKVSPKRGQHVDFWEAVAAEPHGIFACDV